LKGISAGVRVAILFLLLLIGTYIIWRNLGKNPAGKNNQYFFARFRDASGLPKASKVVVAGLPQGEVTDLAVDGRYAKVTFKLNTGIPVWTSATVIKKATSLLGENYLEIDPGEEVRQAPDGTQQKFTRLGPPCSGYGSDDKAKDDACRRVPNVVEATTPDQLLHRIEQTLPNVDRVLESVRDLSEDVRRIVNGPLANVATRVDGLVQREANTVQDIIERADRSMKKIDAITDELRKIASDADPRVQALLKNLDDASADAKDLVATAKKELTDTGDKLRGKLDKLDGVIDDTRSITTKIDQDKGTLGRLVNDPTIADNVEQITEDAKGFLGTLFGLKAYVGLRSEYNFAAKLARNYVTVELHTRPDKFYLIELEKGPRGDYPDVTLTFDPTVDPNHWIRRSIIEDKVRFTFQFAKRFSWLTLRFGIKESTGGIGLDLHLLNDRFELRQDLFGFGEELSPRWRIVVGYEFIRKLWLLGGVDDILNSDRRDYFVGLQLRFNDQDLKSVLPFVGGALAR
jgi:phospholipid/cholesterol/gamma-HCH transport system substrate-binding protein